MAHCNARLPAVILTGVQRRQPSSGLLRLRRLTLLLQQLL